MLKIFHYSDQQLIDFICSGEQKESKAIQYILDQNRKKIKAYVLKNSGDEGDADSILVEGVTHLVFNVRKKLFRGESKLSTYLFSICKGVWLKELRKRKRLIHIEVDKEFSEKMINPLTPLQHFNEKELQTEVTSLLEQLGNACQKVLNLWARHFSMTEIANELGYKNSQIAMNKKNRCLGKLRNFLEENANLSASLKSYLN